MSENSDADEGVQCFSGVTKRVLGKENEPVKAVATCISLQSKLLF
jgi:hypothetical protein